MKSKITQVHSNHNKPKALKWVSTGKTGGSKKIEGIAGEMSKSVPAPKKIALKDVSTGNTGGSKKLASKATQVKKLPDSVLPVWVTPKAPLAKGMKNPKGFRSPYNQ